jgi:citrate synthase
VADDDLLAGWITAEDAATRLGVKTATLYAYVSRGVLMRRRSRAGHSLFDPAEVERLARRGRPRRRSGTSEVTIESGVTALGADRPYFRGRDALTLARSHSLEEVAELLWATGGGPWAASPAAVAAGRAAQAGLPPEVLPIERLQVIVPTVAALDPLRHNLNRDAVSAVGRALIPAMVACLPSLSPLPDAGDLADRLWPRLTADPPSAGLLGVLRTALAVLADHEIAASTLAARVAASVRADPYAAVIAGLGATGGALHGGASLGVEALLAEVGEQEFAGRVIGQRLRRGERIPGFGHAVYRDGDGRAGLLFEILGGAVPGDPVLALADAVRAEAARRQLPAPNIDLALGTFTRAAGMITGAGEAIFAVARTVGWLAHAMEEYEHPTRLRLRATYRDSGP